MSNDKHQLQTILEDCEYKCISYTGRAMNKSCIAVYLRSDIGNMFSDIIISLGYTGPIEMDQSEPFEDISYAFKDMRIDAIRKHTIVSFTSVENLDDEADDSEA